MSKVGIILLEDDPSLGQAGDIVAVSEGYARNFLFPQGKAALATEQAQARQAKRAATQAQASQAELTQLQQQAANLDSTELFLAAKVKDDSQDLYAAIKAKDIATALNDQAKLDIKPNSIALSEPIQALGTYDVVINLSDDVEAKIKLTVQADA